MNTLLATQQRQQQQQQPQQQQNSHHEHSLKRTHPNHLCHRSNNSDTNNNNHRGSQFNSSSKTEDSCIVVLANLEPFWGRRRRRRRWHLFTYIQSLLLGALIYFIILENNFFHQQYRVDCMPNLIRIGALFEESNLEQEVTFIKTIQMINDQSNLHMQRLLNSSSNNNHRYEEQLPSTTSASSVTGEDEIVWNDHKSQQPQLEPLIERLANRDSSYEADNRVCKLLLSGVVAIFGPIYGHSIQHVQSICDTMEIPHLEMHADYVQKGQDLAINLYPPAHLLTAACIDLFDAWNWTSFAIIYEDTDAIIRLQDLFKESSGTWTSKWSIRLFQYSSSSPKNQHANHNNNAHNQQHHETTERMETNVDHNNMIDQIITTVDSRGSINKIGDAIGSNSYGPQKTTTTTFRDIFWKLKDSNETNILLDVKNENLYSALKHAQQVGCMTEQYSYLITSLDLHMIDLEDFKYSKTLITSFKLVRDLEGDSISNSYSNIKDTTKYNELYFRQLGSSITSVDQKQHKQPEQQSADQMPVTDPISLAPSQHRYYEPAFNNYAHDDAIIKRNNLKFNDPVKKALDAYLLEQQLLPRVKMSTASALIHDALILLMMGLKDLDSGQTIGVHSISCARDGEPWLYGSSIVNYMRSISFPGLSGMVSFDEHGLRSGITLDLMTVVTSIGLVKVGEWHSNTYLQNHRASGWSGTLLAKHLNAKCLEKQISHDSGINKDNIQYQSGQNSSATPASSSKLNPDSFVITFDKLISSSKALFTNEELFKKIYSNPEDDMETLIVTTRRTHPYFMLKETPTKREGNDQYEGFAVDLIHELSKLVGFKYKFKEVDDGKYGAKIKHSNGTESWNGMIGEIISGKADLAIVDLTITAQREEAVDFTLPFMSTGISILFKKPTTKATKLFSFLSPFSSDVWAYVLAAYAGISSLLYFVGHISPYEWTNPHPCRQDMTDGAILMNNFSLMNSFWFTTGSLMQQGSDLTPRSMSTRTIAGIWYFFTLIMISSYTANLAAFLTVEKLVYPIESVNDLSKQHEIKYGCVESGSTCTFFNESQIDTYKQIWKTMTYVKSNDEGRKKVEEGAFAFFMESTSIEYIKERNCNLTQIGNLLDSKGYGVATSKKPSRKRPYRTLLSEGILRLQENGQLHNLKNRWWKERRGGGTCTDDVKGGGVTELSLANVGGVFVVLLGGLGASFIVALCEYWWKARKTSPNRDTLLNDMMKDLKFALACQSSTKPLNRVLTQMEPNESLQQNQSQKEQYQYERQYRRQPEMLRQQYSTVESEFSQTSSPANTILPTNIVYNVANDIDSSDNAIKTMDPIQLLTLKNMLDLQENNRQHHSNATVATYRCALGSHLQSI